MHDADVCQTWLMLDHKPYLFDNASCEVFLFFKVKSLPKNEIWNNSSYKKQSNRDHDNAFRNLFSTLLSVKKKLHELMYNQIGLTDHGKNEKNLKVPKI